MCNVERSTVRLYYHTWRWSRWVCTCMCKTPFCCCLVAIGNVVGLTLMPKVPNNLHCTEENIGVRYSSGHSHTFTQSFTHSLTYPLTHTLAHPLTHSFTHTHSLTHSLTPFPQSSAKSSFSSSVSYTTGSPGPTTPLTTPTMLLQLVAVIKLRPLLITLLGDAQLSYQSLSNNHS